MKINLTLDEAIDQLRVVLAEQMGIDHTQLTVTIDAGIVEHEHVRMVRDVRTKYHITDDRANIGTRITAIKDLRQRFHDDHTQLGLADAKAAVELPMSTIIEYINRNDTIVGLYYAVGR